MIKYLTLCIVALTVGGCATLTSDAPIVTPQDTMSTQNDNLGQLEESVEISNDVLIPKGRIFAKTDFHGVIKSSYVKLSIQDTENEEKVYQLVIGDKEAQRTFPWYVQEVQPGYFFVDLPVGNYKIASITIPVGTTSASEPMDITFEVKEDRKMYLGTLKVIGTKEKIKLGGVPIIKPGFEYTADVINEKEEAYTIILERFQCEPRDLELSLMEIHYRSNKDITKKKEVVSSPSEE